MFLREGEHIVYTCNRMCFIIPTDKTENTNKTEIENNLVNPEAEQGIYVTLLYIFLLYALLCYK